MEPNQDCSIIPRPTLELTVPLSASNRILGEMVENLLVLARAAVPAQPDLDALVREGNRLHWLRMSKVFSGVFHSVFSEVFQAEETNPENDKMAEGIRVFQLYHQAATAGHPEGQFGVSICYRDGEGVQKDEQAELEWLRKSAESGYGPAQFHLGDRYTEGLGVPQSYIEAAMWYRKAADQKISKAKLKLSRCYDQGLGVPQDSIEAFKLLRQVVEKRRGEMRRELAVRYQTGDGVAVDLPQAYAWFRLAAYEVAKEVLIRKGWKDAPENTREFILRSVFENDDNETASRAAAIEAEAATVAAAMSPSDFEAAQRLYSEIKERYSAKR